MQQFPQAQETKPHGPVDLRDQSSMFLVLEELGITHMQNEWLRANAPDEPDAAAAAEQHGEFFADLVSILAGEAGPERVEPTGWAGEAMAAHLREAIPAELSRGLAELHPEGASALADAPVRDVAAAALLSFERSLSRLTARQLSLKAAGGEMSPAEYIQLMAGWSSVMSGAAATLELADEVRPWA